MDSNVSGIVRVKTIPLVIQHLDIAPVYLDSRESFARKVLSWLFNQPKQQSLVFIEWYLLR